MSWLPDPTEGVEGPLECVCGHVGSQHTSYAKGWARLSRTKTAWCTLCPCEAFEPNVVFRNSHGVPIENPMSTAGMTLDELADLLDMDADHRETIDRLSDQLASFYYTDLGVLVVLDEAGDEIARLV